MYAKNLEGIMRFSATSITNDLVFTPEQCGQIIHAYDAQLRPSGLGAVAKVDESIRKTLAYPLDSTEAKEIYNTVVGVAIKVNSQIWSYSLQGADPLQLLKYNVGGHYGWHLDIGSDAHMYRKLSFVIPLSPPESYDGGELIVKAGNKERIVPLEQGKMILFPSFILHKVTPVTRGERYMLVGWLRGEKPFV
jgi:PKHD-type hydroxylase